MKNQSNHRRLKDLSTWAQWFLGLLIGVVALAAILIAAALLGSLTGCKKEPDCVVWSPVNDTTQKRINN